ncbi:MAG TPA: hypothetical protein VF702_03635 [Allosphingosinicella sp.]|jgi:hypothetical protein
MAATRHDWWKDLAALSPTIAGLSMPADEGYWDQAANQATNAVAYNLSGCPDHNASIARWVDEMANRGFPLPQIEKLLIDLTSRKHTAPSRNSLPTVCFLTPASRSRCRCRCAERPSSIPTGPI